MKKLNIIYQEKTNGIRIRSKCGWYEHRKIFKIFSKFRDKSRAVQNQIRNMLIGNTEVNNEEDINNEIYLYYKNLFTRNNTYQNMA